MQLCGTDPFTINSTPATIRDDQSFVGWTDLAPGNNSVTLQATDYGDNAGSLNRTVTVVGGVAKVPGYDSNGNLTSVYEPATGLTATNTFDGEDRLVRVVKGGVTYTLTYDGLSRMRKLQTGGTTKTFMWLGSKMAEERDATGATVVKQFFGQGVRDSGVNKFYTFDHLGSIRELVASGGNTVLARYEYDPYGRRTRIAGTQDADFGFTGHYYHAPTGLHLALYRAYDADLGRWLNRDPIGEAGGISLYGYVGNNPINFVDPDGLFFKEVFRDMAHWLYDKMLGEREGSYDQDGNMAQQAAMLGYDEADTLRNAMGEGAGILGDQGTDYAGGAAAGKLLGAMAGAICKKAAKTAPNITFKTGHVTQHLKDLGLPAQKVEAAIAAEVKKATQGASQTGSFWGRVTVDGKVVEYRAFTLPDGTINVGTYYPPTP